MALLDFELKDPFLKGNHRGKLVTFAAFNMVFFLFEGLKRDYHFEGSILTHSLVRGGSRCWVNLWNHQRHLCLWLKTILGPLSFGLFFLRRSLFPVQASGSAHGEVGGSQPSP